MKQAFLERFGKPEEPQLIIQKATSACLGENVLLQSLDRVDHLYGPFQFKMEAKYGFSHATVMKIPSLAALAIYRGAHSNDN